MENQIDYKKLLAKFIKSSDNNKNLTIRKFLEREKISFKNNRFYKIEETHIDKNSGSKFEVGDSLFYEPGNKRLIVQDTKINNRKKIITAIDVDSGKQLTLFQSDPLLEKWTIKNAFVGNAVATDDCVFIFNGFKLTDTGWKVMYSCAVSLHPVSELDRFHVPNNGDYMGSRDDKMFRIPTEMETRLLESEIARHGYTFDENNVKLVSIFRYKPGSWIVSKETKELYQVETFVDSKYILKARSNGSEEIVPFRFENTKFREWKPSDLSSGFIIHYKETNGEEMIGIFDKMQGNNPKCSYVYNIITDEFSKNVLIDSKTEIEPATVEQKNLALRIFSNNTFLNYAFEN